MRRINVLPQLEKQRRQRLPNLNDLAQTALKQERFPMNHPEEKIHSVQVNKASGVVKSLFEDCKSNVKFPN